MPALPAVPSVIRLRLQGQMSGTPWNVVQYARFSGSPPSDTDLLNTGTAVGAAWNAAIAQLCFTGVSLQRVQVTDLTRADAGQVEATTVHLGTRAGSGNPNQVALCASYQIAARYRGGHPRTYWPASVQGDITNGRQWSTTFLTLADGACTDYVGNINLITQGGAPLVFSAVSFYKGKDPTTGKPLVRATPVVYPVISVEVHPRVDTMRSRLGKELS